LYLLAPDASLEVVAVIGRKVECVFLFNILANASDESIP
jgi:hypothetical protein